MSFIRFDACFLKIKFQLLTIVRIDGNNAIYPNAYAVVKSENFDTCKLFIEDFFIDNNHGVLL